MRIHSKFKDYYDSAMGFGIDTTLHYNRKAGRESYRFIKNKLPVDFMLYAGRTNQIGNYQLAEHLIGFCGKVFPCVSTVKLEDEKPVGKYEYIYSNEALQAFLKDYPAPSYRSWTRERLSEFLTTKPVETDALFIEVNAPVFVIELNRKDGRHAEIELTTNPMLKEYQFYKVVDAFTAFQEISMYLGNQLVEREQVSDIADKYKISQHGYDKYSFRKEPQGTHV